MKYICEECEGTNIEMAVWINPNTDRISGPVYPDLDEAVEHDMLICLDCKTQTIIRKTYVKE